MPFRRNVDDVEPRAHQAAVVHWLRRCAIELKDANSISGCGGPFSDSGEERKQRLCTKISEEVADSLVVNSNAEQSPTACVNVQGWIWRIEPRNQSNNLFLTLPYGTRANYTGQTGTQVYGRFFVPQSKRLRKTSMLQYYSVSPGEGHKVSADTFYYSRENSVATNSAPSVPPLKGVGSSVVKFYLFP